MNKTKARMKLEKELQTELERLDKVVSENPSEAIINDFESIQKELACLEELKTKGNGITISVLK